jgi:hypothetical protein
MKHVISVSIFRMMVYAQKSFDLLDILFYFGQVHV